MTPWIKLSKDRRSVCTNSFAARPSIDILAASLKPIVLEHQTILEPSLNRGFLDIRVPAFAWYWLTMRKVSLRNDPMTSCILSAANNFLFSCLFSLFFFTQWFPSVEVYSAHRNAAFLQKIYFENDFYYHDHPDISLLEYIYNDCPYKITSNRLYTHKANLLIP